MASRRPGSTREWSISDRTGSGSDPLEVEFHVSGHLVLLIGGVVVALGLASFVVAAYNSLVQVRNNVDKAFQNIDAYRAHMKHEREVFMDLARLREHYETSRDVDEKVSIESAITERLSKIAGRWEDYPELESSQNFLQIRARVSELETRIADRREFFNDSINVYNIQIERCLDILFAKAMGYTRRAFLAVPEEHTTKQFEVCRFQKTCDLRPCVY